jgi:hypothetical protein
MNELDQGLNEALIDVAPPNPEDYVRRVDILYYKSFSHFRMINSLLTIYALIKILAMVIIVITTNTL